MLPLVVAMMRNNVTMSNVRPELQLHAERIKQCAAQNDEVHVIKFFIFSQVDYKLVLPYVLCRLLTNQVC